MCYKAYAEIEYEYNFPNPNGNGNKVKVMTVVWFAPELNYSFGPAGFDGLPGLVLEKYSSSFYFLASKISFIDGNKKTRELKPKEGIEITNDEYDQMSKKAINKLFKN